MEAVRCRIAWKPNALTPALAQSEAKYPGVNYNIPICEKMSGKRWADHPNALIAPIQHLLNSEDDLSRITALRMSWAVFGNEERLAKNACISYSKRKMQNDERILYAYIFQFVACEQSFPDYTTLFPIYQQDIQRLLRLQQDTYKESCVDIVNGLYVLAKNKQDDKAIQKLSIALKYGKEYISKYHYETCQRTLELINK
jgi:hypothetical protein